MKTFKNLSTFAVLIVMSVVSVSAEVNPAVSKKYTVAEVDQLFYNFRIDHPRDTYPSEKLRTAFKNHFPGATDVDWEKGGKLYEVEFEIKQVDYKAFYDEAGDLIMYKHDIHLSELPENLYKTITAKYPNYRFDDLEKIVKAGETSYKIELEKGDVDVKFTIKPDGSIINETVDY